MDRRRFLQHAGCVMCAAGADQAMFGVSPAAAAGAYEQLDDAGRLKLADMALDLAKQAGAGYADFRIGRTQEEFNHARELRVDRSDLSLSVGFGARVLLDGSWGFAGSDVVEPDAVRRAVALAVENARASRLIQATPIVLEPVAAYQADWPMPMTTDPFTVPAQVKADKLLAINAAALKAGANFCSASLSFVREDKLFASQPRQPHHADARARLSVVRGDRGRSA